MTSQRVSYARASRSVTTWIVVIPRRLSVNASSKPRERPTSRTSHHNSVRYNNVAVKEENDLSVQDNPSHSPESIPMIIGFGYKGSPIFCTATRVP